MSPFAVGKNRSIDPVIDETIRKFAKIGQKRLQGSRDKDVQRD